MASYFGINGDSTSFFTGYFGTSSTNTSSSSSGLGDYAMIQSGAYKKLLNKYYDNNTKSTSSTEVSEEEKQAKIDLNDTKTDATTLSKAATTLKNTDFSNRDTVAKNLQSFVDVYNNTVDATSEVDTKSILRKSLWMIGDTKASADLLKDVGVTIGSDNKLSLNKETLKAADTTTIKTLFSGTNSLADKVGNKATDIVNLSNNALKASSSGSIYTNKGDYSSINTSTLYNSLF